VSNIGEHNYNNEYITIPPKLTALYVSTQKSLTKTFRPIEL
jgi:hypothetical protein